MGILGFETQLDIKRKTEREEGIQDALSRLRMVAQEENLPATEIPIRPPVASSIVQPPVDITNAQPFTSSILQGPGLEIPDPAGIPFLESRGETGTEDSIPLALEQPGVFTMTPRQADLLLKDPKAGIDQLENARQVLNFYHREREVLGLPPLLPGESIGAQATSFGAETLEGADVGRQFVKEEFIEPVVPEFDFGEAPIGPRPLREAFTEAVFEIGGVPQEEREPLRQVAEEQRLAIPLTSGVTEEAISFVLDPINLVFFAGPILKGAGGAAKVAERIRKTGIVPRFVKNAQRLAAQEGGGGRLLGDAAVEGERLAGMTVKKMNIAELHTSADKLGVPRAGMKRAEVEAAVNSARSGEAGAARAGGGIPPVAGGADLPPFRPEGGGFGEGPPRRPVPVPGDLPPTPDEGPVARLTQLVEQAKPARKEQEILLTEERGRRIAKAQEVFRGGEGTPEERFFAGKRELGGDIKKADFEPVRPVMSEDDVQALINQAQTHNFGIGRGFENVRVTDSLMALMGGEVPGKAELLLLEEVFGSSLPLAALRKGTTSSKVWRIFIESTNLPKTVLTTLDHSFPGRQGIKLLPSRPLEWAKSTWAGTKALFSPKVAAEVEYGLLNDGMPILVRFGSVERTVPYSALKKRVNLFHAPTDETVSFVARADEYMSHWATKIPLLGRLVRASQRAWNTSGNKLRSDVLKTILTKMNDSKTPLNIDDVQSLANLLNRATGRGTLGPVENLAPLLNALQLAPRFRASHPQWVFTILNFKNPVAQREAIREVVSFIGAGATLLGALELNGVIKVEKDPRSADFGKIRIGNQRLDFWGGLQPLVRAVAMLSGSRKTSTGDIVSVGPFDVAFRTFRAGMSPLASLFTDVAKGETFIGEELEPTPGVITRELFNRGVPIAWQDVVDAVREEGLRGGLFSGLALIGIGVSTYETFAQERARQFEEETGGPFDPKNGGHWAIVRSTESLSKFAEAQSPQAKESQEFLNKKIEELRIPNMARALEQGAPVGAQFREAWEDFEAIRANSAARLAFGKDRDPADDSAFAAWSEIDRESYRDPVTFQIDYGAYRSAKDLAFARLDPRIQEAMKIVGADDPVVAEWATEYTTSRLVRRELYSISKWQGLTPQQSQALDSFSREVRQMAPIIADQMGRRVTEADVARFLADQRGQPGLADWFIGLQSSTERDSRRNPAYDAFLESKRGFLQRFYPELYSQATLERIGVIEEAPGEVPSLGAPRSPRPAGVGQ